MIIYRSICCLDDVDMIVMNIFFNINLNFVIIKLVYGVFF